MEKSTTFASTSTTAEVGARDWVQVVQNILRCSNCCETTSASPANPSSVALGSNTFTYVKDSNYPKNAVLIPLPELEQMKR